MTDDAATNPQANPRDRRPVGKCRMLVRGLRASISKSTSRLKAMAAERAHTIAITIQNSLRAISPPPEPLSRKASRAPVRANGRAKTECSNLIISSVSRRRFQSIGRVALFYRLPSGKIAVPGTLTRVLQFERIAGRLKGVAGMLEAFALSDQGCVRSNNEDYCLIKPELGLYVLADGMGGARAGERASQLAVDTVVEVVREAQRRDSQVLLTAVEEANRRVLEAARNDASLEGMGTTLVVALETEEGLFIASVGDSRAYLLDDSGFRAITDDQTWVNEVGRPLGLDEDSLRNHPMRHVLTMAVGASAPLTVNYYSVPLKVGALVLISSDGLHGVLDADQIERILRGGPYGWTLEDGCRRLIEAAKEAGGPDNITVILARKSG